MLTNLSVILVRTRFPENIGMVARAMANMGAAKLILVQPERFGTVEYKEKALALATSQGEAILDYACVVETLAEALASCIAAYGTTARLGGMRKEILRPDEAARDIMTLLCAENSLKHQQRNMKIQEGGLHVAEARQLSPSVALVFGSEDRGLTNEEAGQCSRLVNIPTIQGASSLNLAQAVLILLYECMKSKMQCEAEFVQKSDQPAHSFNYAAPRQIAFRHGSRRTSMEEEALVMHTMQDTLQAIGYLPADNPAWFMQPMRRFLRRSGLYRHEFDMLMGICRKIRYIFK